MACECVFLEKESMCIRAFMCVQATGRHAVIKEHLFLLPLASLKSLEANLHSEAQ